MLVVYDCACGCGGMYVCASRRMSVPVWTPMRSYVGGSVAQYMRCEHGRKKET